MYASRKLELAVFVHWSCGTVAEPTFRACWGLESTHYLTFDVQKCRKIRRGPWHRNVVGT